MDRVDLALHEYEKFKNEDFRACQKEAVEYAYDNQKKVTIVTAPTGSGKSVLGMTLGNLYPKFLYLVSSKHLQDQLHEDFPEAEMIMGRSNYSCISNSVQGATAAECFHTKKSPCTEREECPYRLQKQITLGSRRQILNYSYFITESNFIGLFSDYPMVIADEGDSLEDILIGMVSIRFSTGTFRKFGIPKPQYKTFSSQNAIDSWRGWAKESVHILMGSQKECMMDIEHAGMDQDALSYLLKQLRTIQDLINKLTIFTQFVDDTWLLETNRHSEYAASYEVKPTWLTRQLTDSYFFRHGERFLLMSATFPHKDVFIEMMGLHPGDVTSMEIPSTFPISNRQVMLMNKADLRTKDGKVDPDQIAIMQRSIAELLHKHRGEKGIIHTVNWKINEAVMNLQDKRLITHDSSNKIDMLNMFTNSTDDLVFVSPSSTRGIDLADDKSRFNIIAKCPFKNLGDKMVAARVFSKKHRGQYWYQSICAQEIVQACGRSVRHKDDWCVSYIIDKQACNLITDKQALFPRYFIEAVEVG